MDITGLFIKSEKYSKKRNEWVPGCKQNRLAEDPGSKILRNVVEFLLDFTALIPEYDIFLLNVYFNVVISFYVNILINYRRILFNLIAENLIVVYLPFVLTRLRHSQV
jgi:hypothetical protein